MAKLLFKLRNVPADEADEVRAWLQDHAIDFHETPPGPWGISSAGLWVNDDADLDRAKALMADYQCRRREQAQASQAAAQRNGSAETFASLLQARPWYVLGMLLAIIGILVVTVMLPQWLLR